ncbi:16S rRNA (guanine(966)-N(2))-methyltransferase RsmD [Megasphaera coli]|uniref:16S rRNA (guanine(966)-N(2))-methyltransferase RsmD n=1 Tax=Colibacter massiliensis TaxID=1852379 RepID=UPI00094EA65C|nr:16S rRNA (guanine(966)-N(2))-methyltransferase RsmD [Colibacter massiliensis]
MRIISGSAGGRTLKSPRGMLTRPTLDSTRESLFNILAAGRSFVDTRVLDIFAGTGALGLEAISRGADKCVFIDVRTGKLIRENAALCGFTGAVTVLSLECGRALAALKGEHFDYIFADPPYDKNLVNTTLSEVFANKLLTSAGLFIMEHSCREDIEPSKVYRTVREKKYGKETRISFIVNSREGE